VHLQRPALAETFRVIGPQGVEIVALGYNTPTLNIHHREPDASSITRWSPAVPAPRPRCDRAQRMPLGSALRQQGER